MWSNSALRQCGFDRHFQREHFFYCCGVKGFQSIGICAKYFPTRLAQILMGLVPVGGRQISSLLVAIKQKIVMPHAADKRIGVPVARDDQSPQFVILNLPEPSDRRIENREGICHNRKRVVERHSKRRFHQQFSVSLAEVLGNDCQLVQQIAKQVLQRVGIHFPPLLLGYVLLPERYADRHYKGDERTNRLEPRRETGVALYPAKRLCPSRHRFLSKTVIVA